MLYNLLDLFLCSGLLEILERPNVNKDCILREKWLISASGYLRLSEGVSHTFAPITFLSTVPFQRTIEKTTNF